MRLLAIIPYTPTPIRTRPYNILKSLLKSGHVLTVACLTTNSEECAAVESLRSQGIQVLAEPLTKARAMWNVATNILNRAPAQAAYCWQPALNEAALRVVATQDFEAIHIEHLRGAWYGLTLAEQLKKSQKRIPIIWDSVDSISHLFEQAEQYSAQGTSRMMARFELGRTRRYEPWLVNQFSRTLVVSKRERAAFEKLGAITSRAAIEVIPNGVDLDYFSPQHIERAPATILFSGKMSYHANVAAAQYLLDKVVPRVREHVPQVRVVIAGKDPPAGLLARQSPTVEITGTTADLRPYLARATVACAPILYGAGIQNKILEAMAMGTATVTTSQALEGLDAEPERDLLIADDAESLSTALTRILQDPALRRAFEQNGRRYVETHHQWALSISQLERVYTQAIGECQAEGG